MVLHADPAGPNARKEWTAPWHDDALALLGAAGARPTALHLFALDWLLLPRALTEAALDDVAAALRTYATAAQDSPQAGPRWADALRALKLQDGNGAARADPVVDVQGDERWGMMHRLHQEQLAACRGKPLAGLFVGDSIIQQAALSPWWAEATAALPGAVVNLGIGGDQTQHVLWRLRSHLASLADVTAACPAVVVLVGTNNHGHTAAQIAAGILAVATVALELCPRATVTILVSPAAGRRQSVRGPTSWLLTRDRGPRFWLTSQGLLPRGRLPNGTRYKVAQVNRLLRPAIARLGAPVELVEADDLFLDSAAAEIAPALMWDYLHLTATAYAAVGSRLAAALARMASATSTV